MFLFILFFKCPKLGGVPSSSQKLQEIQTGVRGHAGCSSIMIKMGSVDCQLLSKADLSVKNYWNIKNI